jgi:hypothetical protein
LISLIARASLSVVFAYLNPMSTLAAGRPRLPRLIADSFPRIDAYLLNRRGALVNGAITRWQWQLGGTALTVQARCEAGRLFLAIDGGAEELVAIDRLPLSFGGDRPYFVCAACDRRVRFLYLRDGRPACMECHRLVFASKYKNRWSPSTATLWRTHFPPRSHVTSRMAVLGACADSKARRDGDSDGTRTAFDDCGQLRRAGLRGVPMDDRIA